MAAVINTGISRTCTTTVRAVGCYGGAEEGDEVGVRREGGEDGELAAEDVVVDSVCGGFDGEEEAGGGVEGEGDGGARRTAAEGTEAAPLGCDWRRHYFANVW